MTYTCPTCNSTNVYFDAWVAANEEDIRTFSSGWCDDCGKQQTHLTAITTRPENITA